jgi:hypothetical protein
VLYTVNVETYQPVALLEDLPAEGLVRGQVGAIVELLDAETYEVEFVDEGGKTYGLATLKARQVVPLIHAAKAA